MIKAVSALAAAPKRMATSPQNPSDATPAETGAAVFENTAPAFSPLYQQIKTLILRSLQAGEWKPGEA
jgi:GntR family transcriptional regulator